LDRKDLKNRECVDLRIPDASPVRFLHVSLGIRSEDLVRGDEDWEDGRLTIEWMANDGSSQSDYLASIYDNRSHKIPSVVSHPRNAPAIPVLRVENRGRSGTVILEDLEIYPVQERSLWKYGRWLLITAWLLWAAGVAGAFGRAAPKAWLAGCLWVAFGTQIVVPGPWHNDRPIGTTFHFAPPPNQKTPAVPIEKDAYLKVVPLADRPELQGSMLLKVKLAFKKLRPLLHFALFFAPCLIFLILVPRRRAVALAASLAISVEVAQFGFGFGFGWTDIFDLLTNAVGIFAAVKVYGYLQRQWLRRKRAKLHG
jgi:hypothetical protein